MTILHKILVIGDVMLDKYWHSSSTSLSAEAPTAAVILLDTQYRAGGAANVALNIKMLANPQTEISLLSAIGQDTDGNKLKNILNKVEIKAHWLVNGNKPTITKHRIITDHQQLVRVDFEQKYAPILLTEEVKQLIAEQQVIVISDYDKGTLDQLPEIMSYARSLNKIILVDPKGSDFNKYKNASLLTPNLKEFTSIVGNVNADNMANKASDLIKHLNLANLLVTLGADGMTLFGPKQQQYHACSYADHVFDVTGAGDTVIASLAVSMAENIPLNEAIESASHAAALVVSQLGTSYATREKVEKSMLGKSLQQNVVDEQKIIHVTELNEFNKLLNTVTQSEIPLFNWNFNQHNVPTTGMLNAMIKRLSVSNATQICLIVTGNLNQSIAKEPKAHSIQQLVYILSLFKITAKVIYSTILDLGHESTSYTELSPKIIALD